MVILFYTRGAFRCGAVLLHGLGSYRWSYYFILKGHFEVEQYHFQGWVAIDGSTILDLLL